MTVWHDVDERVLLWVADDLPASMELEMVELPNDDEPCERVEGLTNRQVIQALQRLESYGLVAFAREPQGAGANIIFTATRLTALGHQVLNEWPDLDQITRSKASAWRSPRWQSTRSRGWLAVACRP